jgi:hypothetical protein
MKYYSYSIKILSNTAIQTIAVAKKDRLKSYSGGLFVTRGHTIIPITIICETQNPSKTLPPAPQLVNDKPECASVTIQVKVSY